jgi:hypothetical protein
MVNIKALDYVKFNSLFIIAAFVSYGFMLADMLIGVAMPDFAREIMLSPILAIPVIALCHTLAWMWHLGHHYTPGMRKTRIALTATMIIPLGYAIVHVPWQLS